MVKCAKCDKEFVESDSIMVCTQCGAIYHKDCWFSGPTCITKDCYYDRAMPLRGENLDPEMDNQDHIPVLLAKSNTKAAFRKKILPIIIAGVIFLTWIVINSYHDYQKQEKEKNSIIFIEKDHNK